MGFEWVQELIESHTLVRVWDTNHTTVLAEGEVIAYAAEPTLTVRDAQGKVRTVVASLPIERKTIVWEARDGTYWDHSLDLAEPVTTLSESISLAARYVLSGQKMTPEHVAQRIAVLDEWRTWYAKDDPVQARLDAEQKRLERLRDRYLAAAGDPEDVRTLSDLLSRAAGTADVEWTLGKIAERLREIAGLRRPIETGSASEDELAAWDRRMAELDDEQTQLQEIQARIRGDRPVQ